MQPSMELRWFGRGTIPPDVQQWFLQGAFPPKAEPQREDLYLSLPHNDDLGIKQREGRIEVKRRLADRGAQSFEQGTVGRLEQWVKWSFKLEDGPPTDLLEPAGSWISTLKSRSLRKFALLSKEEAQEVDPAKPVDEGCNLELTVLRFVGNDWWSLGFEAFGQLANVERNLRLSVKQAFAADDVLALRAGDSYSYPKWLIIAGAPGNP